MSIEITNIQINKTKSTATKTKAFAKITICGCLVVDGIRIIDGSKGLFIAMPSRKRRDTDEYDDIVFPINKETRAQLTEEILASYKGNSSISNDEDDII